MFVYEEHKNAFEWGRCQSYFTKPREGALTLGLPHRAAWVRNEWLSLDSLKRCVYYWGQLNGLLFFKVAASFYLPLYVSFPSLTQAIRWRMYKWTFIWPCPWEADICYLNSDVIYLPQHMAWLCLSFKKFIGVMCVPWSSSWKNVYTRGHVQMAVKGQHSWAQQPAVCGCQGMQERHVLCHLIAL